MRGGGKSTVFLPRRGKSRYSEPRVCALEKAAASCTLVQPAVNKSAIYTEQRCVLAASAQD